MWQSFWKVMRKYLQSLKTSNSLKQQSLLEIHPGKGGRKIQVLICVATHPLTHVYSLHKLFKVRDSTNTLHFSRDDVSVPSRSFTSS